MLRDVAHEDDLPGAEGVDAGAGLGSFLGLLHAGADLVDSGDEAHLPGAVIEGDAGTFDAEDGENVLAQLVEDVADGEALHEGARKVGEHSVQQPLVDHGFRPAFLLVLMTPQQTEADRVGSTWRARPRALEGLAAELAERIGASSYL